MALSRRDFLAQTGSCVAHLQLAAAVSSPLLRARWTRVAHGPIVAVEPFGRLEEVGPKIWALISTPLNGDLTTVCNGGLIAGTNGVLAVEGFMKPEGAKWLAQKSVELTGTRPSHVLVTHYHGDHANGIAGFRDASQPIAVHATAATTALVREKNLPADPDRTATFESALPVDPDKSSSLDLGGRTVRITPRAGHTPSDVTVAVEDPRLVFAGDLIWNGMFPNYVDAKPSTLKATVTALKNEQATKYIPGHGPVSTPAEVDRYIAMLDEVERAAKEAQAKGVSAADAAKAYTLPPSIGEWILFSPQFIDRAFAAWYNELGT